MSNSWSVLVAAAEHETLQGRGGGVQGPMGRRDRKAEIDKGEPVAPHGRKADFRIDQGQGRRVQTGSFQIDEVVGPAKDV